MKQIKIEAKENAVRKDEFLEFSKQSQIQGNQANNGYNCYGLDVLHKSYLKASIILIQSISEIYCYLIKKNVLQFIIIGRSL